MSISDVWQNHGQCGWPSSAYRQVPKTRHSLHSEGMIIRTCLHYDFGLSTVYLSVFLCNYLDSSSTCLISVFTRSYLCFYNYPKAQKCLPNWCIYNLSVFLLLVQHGQITWFVLLLLLIVRNYYTVLREYCCDVLSMLQNGTLLLSHIYGNLQQNDNSMTSLCAIYATLALLCIEFDIDIVIPGHVQLLLAVQVRHVNFSISK